MPHPRVLAAARVVLPARRRRRRRARARRAHPRRPRDRPTSEPTRRRPRRPSRSGTESVAAQPVYVIAEIGLNHNGDVDIAKRLIDVAADAGVQAVKFQKRTPEISTPEHMKRRAARDAVGHDDLPRLPLPGRVRREQYIEIGDYATLRGLDWFASPWDVPSVDFLEDLDVVAHKVASACVTDLELLRAIAATGKPVILSTGMSTIEEIDAAVEVLGTERLILLHATSTYPMPPEEANLRMIAHAARALGVPVGYSGHERGLQISLAAVALGAVAVERHITLDRTMWGSDQAASLEPQGLEHLVRDIRIIEEALGDGVKRVFPGELAPPRQAPTGGLTPLGLARRRVLVVADTDSYVKWGAALAARLPADWTARVVVLRSPVMPSPRQLRIALKGTGFAPEVVGETAVDDLVTLIAADEPDAVLLSLRGPLVRVVSPLIMRMPNRPVLLSGFPGITIPAERKAVIFRELVDLIVLHSRREVRDFSANAADLGVDVAFGLATFPFLASVGSASAIRNAVVFAAQAKVPAEREDRIRLLGWLADAARAQPEHRVVVKVRRSPERPRPTERSTGSPSCSRSRMSSRGWPAGRPIWSSRMGPWPSTSPRRPPS